jgi:hypothetical protein
VLSNQFFNAWDGGISRALTIDLLANAYVIRAVRFVGDRAENFATAIKHATKALRGMEKIPLLKTTATFSTYCIPLSFGSALLWLSRYKLVVRCSDV